MAGSIKLPELSGYNLRRIVQCGAANAPSFALHPLHLVAGPHWLLARSLLSFEVRVRWQIGDDCNVLRPGPPGQVDRRSSPPTSGSSRAHCRGVPAEHDTVAANHDAGDHTGSA
jgi:hypothetical protein